MIAYQAIGDKTRVVYTAFMSSKAKTTYKLYREGKDYTQINSKFLRAELNKKAPLEVFAFEQEAPGEHWIMISTPELTSICPFTDYPDFGSIEISYVPNKVCLELKSFKLYINAFRDIKIFHETLTEVIFADAIAAVKPKKMKLEIKMNPRGNISTVCRKSYNVN